MIETGCKAATCRIPLASMSKVTSILIAADISAVVVVSVGFYVLHHRQQ